MVLHELDVDLLRAEMTCYDPDEDDDGETDDPAPVRAWRYGAVVIVETDHRREVLTPAEANELAAVLILQSDLARRTPRAGQTKQLPGGDES